MYLADGHTSIQCTIGLCKTNSWYANQSVNVCRPQRENLFAIFARLEPGESLTLNLEYLNYILIFIFVQSSSDLLGLIQVMIVTFGEHPPVYAKPKESVAPYPSQRKLFWKGIVFHTFTWPMPFVLLWLQLLCLSPVAAQALQIHTSHRTRRPATISCHIHRVILAISHHIRLLIAHRVAVAIHRICRHRCRHRCPHQVVLVIIICTVRWV